MDENLLVPAILCYDFSSPVTITRLLDYNTKYYCTMKPLFLTLFLTCLLPSRGHLEVLATETVLPTRQDMLARTATVAALCASATAFSPMMSMDLGRRQVVQTGAAAAAAAPLLRPSDANALTTSQKGKFCAQGAANGSCDAAPVITIFDHRGCTAHDNTDYKGKKSGDQDDEMLVKVELLKIKASESRAAAQLAESISFSAKGIDGDYHKVPGGAKR